MSNSPRPRVEVKTLPPKPIKRSKYRNAIKFLTVDFQDRCAYSMQHTERAGKLEVDHFDPRLKKNLIQPFDNLLPASRHCNGIKSNTWPNREEQKAGCRFLHPGKETDYGVHIFEDAKTHRLIGVTPAGRWHIVMCGLNAPPLIKEREKRSRYHRQLEQKPIQAKAKAKTKPDALVHVIKSMRSEVDLMIPPIKFFGEK